jgi:hypothetical protein
MFPASSSSRRGVSRVNNLLRRASASYQSFADRIIIAYAHNVPQSLPPSGWALRLGSIGHYGNLEGYSDRPVEVQADGC